MGVIWDSHVAHGEHMGRVMSACEQFIRLQSVIKQP